MYKILANKYCLLFKTGDAELRALENLWCGVNNIFPIVELTRGRKSSKDKIGEISKRFDRIKNIFKGKDICLDLTTAIDLANEEIIELFKPLKGYEAWINFLFNLQQQQIFRTIVPTILVDTNDRELSLNLELQVKKMLSNFSHIAYRNDIADDGCYEDIEVIGDLINKSNSEFYFVVDCEYIAPGSWQSYAEKVAIRVEKIRNLINKTHFIIISTSFPKYVTDVTDFDSDIFMLNEIDLFEQVLKNVNPKELYYGDYGSINPVRNDLVVMSRGWIPRIDVPLKEEIFFYRMKRDKREYSDTYIELAREYVTIDPRYPKYLDNNWGINQINLCATGNSPGSRPSFWISIRMNIHIEQQLLRLKFI